MIKTDHIPLSDYINNSKDNIVSAKLQAQHNISMFIYNTQTASSAHFNIKTLIFYIKNSCCFHIKIKICCVTQILIIQICLQKKRSLFIFFSFYHPKRHHNLLVVSAH